MMDDSDCLMECPYNKSHRVQKSRMQTHLFKCRKNYPTMELKRCPFNANHDIIPAELQHHMESCPDRGTVQTHLAQTIKERTPVIMPYVAPVLPNEGENWDCDEPVQTYDPTAKNINFKVLRGLQGASKSERKHHRQQERLRFNAVAENGGLEGAVGGYVENKPPTRKEETIDDKHTFNYNKEVRQPKTTSRTFAIPPAVAANASKTPEISLKSSLNIVQAPNEWSLSSEDMPSAKPLATGSYSLAKGLSETSEAIVTSPEQIVQVPQLAVPSWMKAAGQPPLNSSYKVAVSVDTGDGVPVPNLERDFPALGRGRGRIRDNPK